jgi:hypothetical protein
MDVNGNDNTPEWGYCTIAGCTEAAWPVWLKGSYPDDPDLLLCESHFDQRLAEIYRTLQAAYHALQSYACGNGAPDLASEVALAIEKVIEI